MGQFWSIFGETFLYLKNFDDFFFFLDVGFGDEPNRITKPRLLIFVALSFTAWNFRRVKFRHRKFHRRKFHPMNFRRMICSPRPISSLEIWLPEISTDEIFATILVATVNFTAGIFFFLKTLFHAFLSD